MLKDHKRSLILSSLVTLLPIPAGLILWNRFPDRITTHWGFDGQPDGWSSVSFAVLAMPLILLAVHWLCLFLTLKDPGNKGRNRKPLKLVLWIMPILSCLSSGITYAVALELEFSPASLMNLPMGLMFAAIGNYMPKMKMNATMGIKVPWAYSSEANWNATHRFGGRLWLAGGLVIAAGSLLPGDLGIWVMLLAIGVMTVVPTVYSWRFYRKEKAEGKALLPLMPQVSPRAGKLSALFLGALLVFVAVLMFAGDIEVTFAEESFTVDSVFYSPLTVDYAVIEHMEYREGPVNGVRTSGFGSARLLLGYFHNEEFGTYTRYTYTGSEECIVIRTETKTLVLAGKTGDETGEIYRQLQSKWKNQ